MLRIHVKLHKQKIHCFCYGNKQCHVSELVSASGVPNICVIQVEVEFSAPSKRCLVMVCYVTTSYHSAMLHVWFYCRYRND